MEGLSSAGTKAGKLQRAALKVLLEHQRTGQLPTSNRYIFYELEHAGVVRKKTKEDRTRRTTGWPAGEQDLIDATKRLRDIGLIPWDWMVDETRSVTEWQSAASVIDFLRDSVEDARIDPWSDEPAPLILTESRTFGGVLRRTVAAEYLCPVASTNGQVGGFLHTDVVPVIKQDGGFRRVCYIGDLDLQGGQIERNTRRVLERELGVALDWTRLALTEEQAERAGLIAIQKIDTRHKNGGLVHDAIEVEVLGQGVVTEIVRVGLDGLLPVPLKRVLEREGRERAAARKLLA